MALDPNIPLSVRPPQLMTPADMISFRDAQTMAQMRQLQLQEGLQQQKERGATRNLWADPNNIDPATGQLKPEALQRLRQIDPEAAQQQVNMQFNVAHLQSQTQAAKDLSADRTMKLGTERVKLANDAMAGQVSAYDGVVQSGGTPQVALQRAREVGLEKIDEMEKSGMLDPTAAAEARKKNEMFDPQRAKAHLMTQKEFFAKEDKHTQESPVAVANADFKAGRISKAERDALVRKETHVAADQVPAGAPPSISKAAVDQAARSYLKDGRLPTNLGRGQQGANNISSIMDRAAEIDPNANIAGARETFAADKASLTKMQSQYDAVTAFEKTAIRNGDRLLDLADKVDKTGMPAIERWIRSGRQATGDVDVAQFNAQMLVYRNEAAKILTNPNLSGQLTDSARHEVAEFLSGSSSAPQIRGVVTLLKSDFENRKKTLEEQIAEIKDRNEPGKGKEPPAQAAGEVATPASQADYDKLPKGSAYRMANDPPGTVRRKQ